MQAKVEWVNGSGMRFLATSEDGHTQLFESGDGKTAPSPMEGLLMAAGACSMVDIVMILQKMRKDVRGIECRLEGERAKDDPRVFVTAKFHYVLTGKALDADSVRRAIELSLTKYCSVGQTIEKAGAKVTNGFEIRDAA